MIRRRRRLRITSILQRLGPSTLRWGMGFWPPFLGAGIRVDYLSPDWREARTSMKLRWYNRNYFGTHFGGSLFSMTDPFFALLVVNSLGRKYIVWDVSSNISFKKPGMGRVFARFQIDDKVIDLIRQKTNDGERYLHEFSVNIVDGAGDVVAEVKKTLYVRTKKPRIPEQ